MTEDQEYLNLGEAADLLGVDRRRLRLLLERNGVETTEDPLDFRKRLVTRQDIDRLAALISRTKKGAA
jgi:hypothetical protein